MIWVRDLEYESIWCSWLVSAWQCLWLGVMDVVIKM